MSKKQFKSQASSSRAVSGSFATADGLSTTGSFGNVSSFGGVSASPLSYVYEPPDLSNISDPMVIVSFKNLQKKDSTTKAKALEELELYIRSLMKKSEAIEEAIVEAWIIVYPRASIDNARRVRQLAHSCQGSVCVSFGKRIAKSLPALVGPWLAGLYDTDRTVTRAAQESLRETFPSEEKLANLWRLYKSSIIEYCQGAATKESVHTLSDERTTSPDDALAKHARVVGAAILVVARVIEIVEKEDPINRTSSLDEFLVHGDVWGLASHSEAFVRRAVYKLLLVALGRKRDSVDMKLISANVLTAGLHTDQTGSNLDFVKTLAILTQLCPEVWTTSYSGSSKKSATSRLQQYLKKGSQSSAREFWPQIGTLVQHLPDELCVAGTTSKTDEAEMQDAAQGKSALLEATLSGLRIKSEPRVNLGQGWITYLQMLDRVQILQKDDKVRQQLQVRYALPLLQDFVDSTQNSSEWTKGAPHNVRQSICVKAFFLAWKAARDDLGKQWRRMSAQIVECIRVSLPEQSKDYLKSQTNVAKETRKWYAFQAAIMKESWSQSVQSLFNTTATSEVKAATELLAKRNGKPFGAAAALTAAADLTPELFYGNPDLRPLLYDFLKSNFTTLLLSPSVSYIMTIIDLSQSHMDVLSILQASFPPLKEEPDSSAKLRALESIVSSPIVSKIENIEVIQDLMNATLQDAINGDESSWSLVQAMIRNPAIPSDLVDGFLSNMLGGLEVDSTISGGLRALDITARSRKDDLLTFTNTPKGSELISRLLLLIDSADASIASQAKSIIGSIQATNKNEVAIIKSSLLDILAREFDPPTASSLPVDTLVAQARRLLEETDNGNREVLAGPLFPNGKQWNTALSSFLSQMPNPALAVTNPLSTVIGFIDDPASAPERLASSVVPRDAEGLSSATRLALYCTRLFTMTDVASLCSHSQMVSTYSRLDLVQMLANDRSSVEDSNALWEASQAGKPTAIFDDVLEIQSLCTTWSQSKPDLVRAAQQQTLDCCDGSSITAYYNARRYSATTSQLRELHGSPFHEDDDASVLKARAFKESGSIFYAIAILSSVEQSKELTRFSNELLADLTDLSFEKQTRRGWRLLLQFNAAVNKENSILDQVSIPRLVFFVKALVKALVMTESGPVRAEILRALIIVLPCVKDTYETFWGDILKALPIIWSRSEVLSAENVPLIHATLKLLTQLQRLIAKDSNDDLEESWRENQETISNGLVGLMMRLQGAPDANHQPRRMVNELLSRHVTKSPPRKVPEPSGLYPIIASESPSLQQATYNILHNVIPAEQEQKSLDKALTKDYIARIPEELLSLILAAPDEETLAASDFERSMPLALRSYLLSWKLVYDHWTNASFPVQADYAASLKDGTYLNSFLDFAAETLITGRTRPVNASKFDIMDFSPQEGESPEKETHSFLIHLYTLSLICLPNLSKAWWRGSTSRQTTIDVESWTEKYISPLIIARELATVNDWAPSPAAADQPLIVKVSASTRQVTASIPIDEQTMSIAIHLPPSYPLQRATVDSVHRVGVDEKKWRSWLITTQGVINFSSEGNGGSLIEGLMAWRKNVTATLKGQTECSICYSVVSAEKQLPSKRCATCRNMFHGACLYRWFKSSNSSSCPLCRNAFHYS